MSSNTSKKTASQYEKFKQAAREAETDDREDAFDRIVKKIAKPAPSPKDKKAKTAK